jgi:hypothetical protein
LITFLTDILHFDWQVVINEFIDGKIAGEEPGSNTDLQLIVLKLHKASLRSESVDTFFISEEKLGKGVSKW